MSAIKKYWREFLIGVLVVLLGINVYLLIRQEKRTNVLEMESKIYQKTVEGILERNNKILEETKASSDSLQKALDSNKIIVVTKKEVYETRKIAPINTNYTSSELSDWIKSLESEAKSSRK